MADPGSSSITDRDSSTIDIPDWVERPAKFAVMARFVRDLASLSHCKRAHVAAIVTDLRMNNVLSIGYNGPPSGIDNCACTEEPGNCGCVHAEMNALLKLNTSQSNLMLIATTCPCVICAGMIINNGKIKYVAYDKAYRNSAGEERLTELGIIHSSF